MAQRPPLPHLAEFKRLKRLHPHKEHDELWKMAGLLIPGIEQPSWADGRASPKPAFYRADPRQKRGVPDSG